MCGPDSLKQVMTTCSPAPWGSDPTWPPPTSSLPGTMPPSVAWEGLAEDVKWVRYGCVRWYLWWERDSSHSCSGLVVTLCDLAGDLSPPPIQVTRASQHKGFATLGGCSSAMDWGSGPMRRGYAWLDFYDPWVAQCISQQLEPGSPWTSSASSHSGGTWAPVRVGTGLVRMPVPDRMQH